MKNKRILIVEDHPANLKLMKELLEMKGLEAHAVSDGLEVQKAACDLKPDLILMDLQIPNLDGYEATRRLKADPGTAGIPVVAVTAYALSEDEKRTRAEGFADYFSKPLAIPAFMSMLDRFLG